MKHVCSSFAGHAGRLAKLTVLAFGLAQMASAADLYVTTNGTGDGSSWASPTNSIQGAINAIATGATNTVWVSNGVYNVGGVTNYPAGTILTNRIAIWKAITVRSANNDPTNTIIKGNWATNDVLGFGPAAVRCVYMTNGSSLIGFTLTNGATLRTNESAQANDRDGGGVFSPSTNTVISNCIITANSAIDWGGGSYYGTLFNCTLSGNKLPPNTTCYAAGAALATLYNCMLVNNGGAKYGGGARNCTLYSCTIVSNTAVYGGGVAASTLYNCLLTYNSASWSGGADGSILYNCTVVKNASTYAATGTGGGAGSLCSLYNCIVYSNTAASGNGPNWYSINGATNCCTIAGTGQVNFVTNGNITNYPAFANYAAADFHLRADSPCVNTGTNFSWMTDGSARSKDLDGKRRISPINGTVDMGAYELYLNRGTILGFR